MADSKTKVIKDDKKYLYLMDQSEVVDYVLKNYNILQGVDLNKIKQIEQDYDKNIYVLMNDGNIFVEKEMIMNNVDRIYFLNALCIYAITKDNRVISITNPNSNLSNYINNNDCRYKKIVTTHTTIACLTEEGTVKAISDETMIAFIPEIFQDVTDIKVVTDKESHSEIVLVFHDKTNKWDELYIH